MKFVRWGATGLVLLLVGVVIGAVLDDQNSEPTGAAAPGGRAAPQPTATPTTTPKPRKAVKRKQQTRPPTATKATPAPKLKPPAFVACDPNIRANADTTTCAFAQNVFYEYWYSWNYTELSAFAAYSAAADRWFDMRCTGAGTIRCTAADGGEVRFPMSAVVAYTERNADTYSASHTVSATPDDYYAGAVPEPSEPDYGASEPDYGDSEPSYGGDLDCSEIAETDFPTPPGDPDGLDADGDGVACES